MLPRCFTPLWAQVRANVSRGWAPTTISHHNEEKHREKNSPYVFLDYIRTLSWLFSKPTKWTVGTYSWPAQAQRLNMHIIAHLSHHSLVCAALVLVLFFKVFHGNYPFHTIFGCSRSVWIIHHLQDGLQRCCLMLLHLFARFGDLVKAYLKVTVCIGFCRLSEITPASNYIFFMEARCQR